MLTKLRPRPSTLRRDPRLPHPPINLQQRHKPPNCASRGEALLLRRRPVISIKRHAGSRARRRPPQVHAQ